MPSRGLLRDPSLLWNGDAEFQRSTIVQVYMCFALLALSAFYHYVIRKSNAPSKGTKDEDIAQIDKIIVYPIKSCHGVSLDEADISKKGLQYDRRWLIVQREGLKWLSLREEPKMTFIIPSFEEVDGNKVLRLRLSEQSDIRMPVVDLPLDPDEETTSKWNLLPPLDFYGSKAQGRVVESASGNGDWKGTPSEWFSKALGYEVYFLYFDRPTSKRQKFPILKPPSDLDKWEEKRREELQQHTDIEFQDEYPFLITTKESLSSINTQLEDGMSSPTSTLRIDKEHWSAQRAQEEAGIKMQTFRPNIVLKGRTGQSSYPAFSEDSWETIWINNEEGTLPIHLVARCKRCLLTAVDPET